MQSAILQDATPHLCSASWLLLLWGVLGWCFGDWHLLTGAQILRGQGTIGLVSYEPIKKINIVPWRHVDFVELLTLCRCQRDTVAFAASLHPRYTSVDIPQLIFLGVDSVVVPGIVLVPVMHGDIATTGCLLLA